MLAPNEEVLEMLIDRLTFLQAAFPCRENAIVITKLEESLMWLNKRTADRVARIPARAKRVIFLCMSGGPAQLDTFDYKPQKGQKKHPGSVFNFSQHGESGLWISELMPETARRCSWKAWCARTALRCAAVGK